VAKVQSSVEIRMAKEGGLKITAGKQEPVTDADRRLWDVWELGDSWELGDEEPESTRS